MAKLTLLNSASQRELQQAVDYPEIKDFIIILKNLIRLVQ
jgi:hypothetical protein